jgi:hypothetical protein
MEYIGEYKADQLDLKQIAKQKILEDTFMVFATDNQYEKGVFSIKEEKDSNRIYLTIYYSNLSNLERFIFTYNKYENKLYYERSVLDAEDINIIKSFKNQANNNLRLVK